MNPFQQSPNQMVANESMSEQPKGKKKGKPKGKKKGKCPSKVKAMPIPM